MNIDALAREIVQKIEDANVGFDFACEADREEARAIVAAAIGANVGAEERMVAAVDAAMIEMTNIHPPLRRSECERLIRAALSVGTEVGAAPSLGEQFINNLKQIRPDA